MSVIAGTAASLGPACALPGKLLVLQPVRDDAVGAEAAHLVLLVVLEVALEPLDMALAFEGEDVRGDPVDRICR